MWDNIYSAYQFLATVFIRLSIVISQNQLLRIAILIPVVCAVIFLFIWFFEELQSLDLWQGRTNGSLYRSYAVPFRYAKYKNKNNRVGKPEQYYKKQELSQAEKSEKLQRELIRKQKQDDYLQRNDEIRKIEYRLTGVDPKYRRAVAEQIYRNKVRHVAKYAQQTVDKPQNEEFDDTDEY